MEPLTAPPTPPPAPRRRRLSPWVLLVLAVVINAPVVNHLLTQRSIDRSGLDVQAALVGTATSGEGSGAAYGLVFRFDDTIDPAQTLWTAEVDRATFQSAVDAEVVQVRVLADRPSAYTVEGAITTRLGVYLTLGGDVVLLGVVLLLRRRGRRVLGPLVLDAVEDVRALPPAAPSQTGLDDLGGATYLVTGEVSHIEPAAVVIDTGVRQVRVVLGVHRNLVGYQQPGRVTARLPG